MILELVVGTAVAFALAPLLPTVAKRTKAFWQCRRGPPLLQGYYDLAKLFRKGRIVSEDASWVTTFAPVGAVAALAAATALLPLATPAPPVGFAGDLFALVYLLAAARFLTALAGLDPASPFGGLGSSRELAFASLIEPGLAVALLAFAVVAGTTGVADVRDAIAAGDVPPALALAVVALLVLVVAELNRVPVDNPATHLELTMVHEAMVLEQSGPALALVEAANGLKHVVLLGLVATVLVPWTLPGALGVFGHAAKAIVLMIAIATAESWMAKWRVFRVPELTTVAFVLAAIAFFGTALLAGGGV